MCRPLSASQSRALEAACALYHATLGMSSVSLCGQDFRKEPPLVPDEVRAPSSCCLFTSLRSFGWLAGNKAPLPPENTSTAARGSYSPVCRSAFSDLRNDYHLSRWVGLFPHPPASQIGHHDHAVADLPHDSPQRHSAPLVGP